MLSENVYGDIYPFGLRVHSFNYIVNRITNTILASTILKSVESIILMMQSEILTN